MRADSASDLASDRSLCSSSFSSAISLLSSRCSLSCAIPMCRLGTSIHFCASSFVAFSCGLSDCTVLYCSRFKACEQTLFFPNNMVCGPQMKLSKKTFDMLCFRTDRSWTMSSPIACTYYNETRVALTGVAAYVFHPPEALA